MDIKEQTVINRNNDNKTFFMINLLRHILPRPCQYKLIDFDIKNYTNIQDKIKLFTVCKD